MTARRALFVIGAGGLAREMAQLARHVGAASVAWDFAGFIGGATDEVGRDLRIGRVVGNDDWLLAGDVEADLVIGIGDPIARAAVASRFVAASGRFEFPNLIHPAAVLDAEQVAIGRGNCITAGCIFTTNIVVGDFNLFNLQTTVGHDTRVGSFNVINPSSNLSGGTIMGDRILVGTGAQILEGRSIGDAATIGAGAVVTKDVAQALTVVGIPARPIER